MKRVMIKYKVSQKKYSKFLVELEAFTNTIQKDKKDIVEYSIFQAPDKCTFVHYISYVSAETEQKHLSSRSVKQFNKKIMQCALGEPLYIELNENGQAQGLMPNLAQEEQQQDIDTSLYRTENELGIINTFTS